ncbi:hypothetical protein [Magnetospira sp. QH-2]|uniref:hypothetical protein n=1 Tax=Magnetospira sp. (strain QH-2) TaxID=1288970 RepID=UPI00208FDBB9|nr:hypothetical protein [Magnetospira sp. QH-2]
MVDDHTGRFAVFVLEMKGDAVLAVGHRKTRAVRCLDGGGKPARQHQEEQERDPKTAKNPVFYMIVAQKPEKLMQNIP